MNTTATPGNGYPASLGADSTGETKRSGVSWAAIFAGAVSAAALSLILAVFATTYRFASQS